MMYPGSIGWTRPARPRAGRSGVVVVRPERAVRAPWSRRKAVKTVLASIALAALAAVAAVVTLAAVMVYRLRPTIPSVAEIAAYRPATATHIYSSDGVLLADLDMQNRVPVRLSDIAPSLVEATLAVEDNRFYNHSGIDWRGVARAAVDDLTGRDATAEGASTITQQLARNVAAFHISHRKTLQRKVREAMTAVRIEQVFSKDDILEMYLNQIYYGSGAYGVEAAARTYFGKSARSLTLPEAALLAGLPQRPNVYSPYRDRAAAKRRRDVVLQRMLETGRIDHAQYESAAAAPVRVAGVRPPSRRAYRAPYFVDWVARQLIARYGVDAVYSGWDVVTTLDWRMQERAESALRRGLSYGATQGALIAIDPHSGAVRAMVGGVDYAHDQFNIATDGLRQPGSAFKPIVYAAAIDTGTVGLYSEVPDQKLTIANGSRDWVVHDYEADYRDADITVLDAIANSVNTVAVQVAQQTGIPTIIDYARRLGITTPLAPYLPLALGASAVRPIDLCSAYGAFAAGGQIYRPYGVRSISDAIGRSVYRYPTASTGIATGLQSSTVDAIDTALRVAVERGTGTAARVVPNAFGKTGTTNDRRDAWFVGFTPELSAAVWVGRPYRDMMGMVEYRSMPGATGGRAAAPIWADFMGTAAPVQRRYNAMHGAPIWSIAVTVPPPPSVQPPARQLARGGAEIDTADSLSGGQQSQWTGAPAADANDSSGAYGDNTGFVDSAPRWNPPAAETSRPWSNAALAGGSDGSASVSGASLTEPSGAGSSGVTAANLDTISSARHVRRAPHVHLVRLCADSGMLATRWCPTTVTVDVGDGSAPTRSCALHRAPPGE